MELRYTNQNNKAVASFTVAVQRRFNKDEADFINCTAWGNNAEFIDKYFKKGSMISIVGRIQTGSYEKDGQKVYRTDVIVEENYFCGSKSESTAEKTDDGFRPLDDGSADELPF